MVDAKLSEKIESASESHRPGQEFDSVSADTSLRRTDGRRVASGTSGALDEDVDEERSGV